jgi:hypothetical protein
MKEIKGRARCRQDNNNLVYKIKEVMVGQMFLGISNECE